MRLRETQNALQLLVFFFSLFCQRYPRLRNCKLPFLILKILQYGGSGSDFSFFQGIHVSFDIRIDISISIKPTITKFGSRYIYRIWFISLIKQVPVTSLLQDQLKICFHYQGAFGHQTWQNGNLPWLAPVSSHITLWSRVPVKSRNKLTS